MQFCALLLSLLLLSETNRLFASPTSVNSIPLPKNYFRVEYPPTSFPNYLQNLPLKKEKKVTSYKNEDLSNRYTSIAVIDKPLLFKDDLEQCADFTMRLWADFHKESNLLSSLYLFNYSGKKYYFKDSRLSYQKYLRKVFASSNSHSIKKGTSEISNKNLKPGDLFVQNESGGIGHVSIILDHSKSDHGEDLYLIGFSFMPAQEMHIEKAPDNRGKSGWFSYSGFIQHLTENYPYGIPVLRRF